MAVKYEALLPEILPAVRACPDSTIEQHIRSAVIDMCEKTEIYQVELDPITVVQNIYEYDLEAPSGTVVHRIRHATFNGDSLEPISSGLLEQRLPKWRDSTGNPEYFVKQGQSQFWLVPVPRATQANAVILRAILKPTHTSTACDDYIMNDFRDAIVNGTLTRLLRLPKRDWTDYGAAGVYNSLYNEHIEQIKKRAKEADSPVVAKVRYGGIHRGRPLRKYANKKTFI